MGLLAASFSFAAIPSDKLSALLSTIQSMQANFVQTIYNNHGKAIHRSYGRMAIARPGKFRWEVKKPIPQVIIANQTRLWIYDADLEQVTIRPLGQVAGDAPGLLLSQAHQELGRDYQVKFLPLKNSNELWFELTPKKSGNMLESIQMGFRGDQINQMQLKDHLGHRTVIQYQNIQTNIKLSNLLFQFKAPKNTDIIDETK